MIGQLEVVSPKEFMLKEEVKNSNEAINKMLQKNVDKTMVSSQAHNKYSDERMNQQYFDLYKSILEK